MISDMIHNKKLDSIVTELFIRGKKLNISLAFITQSYFKVPKDVGLNTTHFFIAKTLNKRNLREISINHSPDVSTKDFNRHSSIIHQTLVRKISVFLNDTMLALEKIFLTYNKNHVN